MSQPKLPPFRSLLKSTEVEDPVNLYVHRPLAFAFVWSIFKTPITPNMVTLMAVIAGAVSGAMFLWGTPGAMIAAGALLWTSAILDGADGLLARAKNLQSQFGRAIDGWADGLVAAFTVIPAFVHIWLTHREPLHLVLMVPALLLTNVHLQVYDYYKESYLRMTRLDRGGEGEDPKRIRGMVEDAREKGYIAYLAMKGLVPYLETQQKFIAALNPAALREGVEVRRSEQSAEIYRRHNLAPMRLWMIVVAGPAQLPDGDVRHGRPAGHLPLHPRLLHERGLPPGGLRAASGDRAHQPGAGRDRRAARGVGAAQQ